MNRRSFIGAIVAGLAAIKIWPTRAKVLTPTPPRWERVPTFVAGANGQFECLDCGWRCTIIGEHRYRLPHNCKADLESGKYQMVLLNPPANVDFERIPMHSVTWTHY